jgi:hydroxyacylglutathione hydrolase
MILKRYFVNGLAHASYLIGDGGEAAVVDPKRDVVDYIEDAEAAGMRIVAIFNTHPHADFASGFAELAERTSARIYTSHLAPATYDHVAAKDGDKVVLGGLEVELLETPGHSPDSLSFLVRDRGTPKLVFTGDLLFVNDVGRPDLRDTDEDPSTLADKLYSSLFNKILTLPDDVKVYPAHGAGSLCGRAISSAPYSTVADEKSNNWAAQITDRKEFIKQMVSNLPARPAYFNYDVGINLAGAAPLAAVPTVDELTADRLHALVKNGTIVIDTRSAARFGEGHFPGSLNIGVGSPMFSTWIGFLVPGGTPIALVAEGSKDAAKAKLELARIGFDNIVGYLKPESIDETAVLPQLSVCDLRSHLDENDPPLVIDVRTPNEWTNTHIASAKSIPLSELPNRLAEIPKEQPVAVICGSGYRSSIAASMLQAHGISRLQNVTGGMSDFLEKDCPQMKPADLVFDDSAAA